MIPHSATQAFADAIARARTGPQTPPKVVSSQLTRHHTCLDCDVDWYAVDEETPCWGCGARGTLVSSLASTAAHSFNSPASWAAAQHDPLTGDPL